jgi:hypothetical protein
MNDQSTKFVYTARQQSYLLRLWPVVIDDQVVWRAYLERIPGGQGHGFASLERLIEYLRLHTHEEEQPSDL